MATHKITLRPGINTQATPTLNSAGWSESNLIRFFQGLLQRVGGWQKLINTPAAGTVRALHAYLTIYNEEVLGIATDAGFQIAVDGTIYTAIAYPQASTLSAAAVTRDINGNLANVGTTSMTSTGGSKTVTVTDTSFNPTVGSTVTFLLPCLIGNVYLPGGTAVTVTNAPSGTTWEFELPVNAGDSTGGPFVFSFTGIPVSPTPTTLVLINWKGYPSNPVNASFAAGQSITTTQSVVSTISNAPLSIAPATYTFTTTGLAPGSAIDTGASQILNGQSPFGYQGASTPQFPISYGSAATYPDNPAAWSEDNLGTNLLFCWEDGPVYVWQSPLSTPVYVTKVTQASQINTGLLVAMPQAQLITYGSESVIGGGQQDPLLVRFSDVGSYTSWTASATNQAGSYRLSRGSRIVGAIQSSQFTMLWTDIDLWAMTYTGPPLVYSFNMVATGCGLIAQKARANILGNTYWMGLNSFYTYSNGGVRSLPCDVWDEIFPTVDTDSIDKIWAWANSSYDEVWWFFPSSGGGGECDSYVKLNVTTGLWDYGLNVDGSGGLSRTAGIDQSIFGQPLAADSARYIQQHETGYDADGVAMSGAFAQSGYADIGDGTNILFIDQVIPDLKWLGNDGAATLYIYGQNFPGDTPVTYGPYTLTPTTRFISLRSRKRQLAYRIEWQAQRGYNARVGAIRVRGAPAGRW